MISTTSYLLHFSDYNVQVTLFYMKRYFAFLSVIDIAILAIEDLPKPAHLVALNHKKCAETNECLSDILLGHYYVYYY